MNELGDKGRSPASRETLIAAARWAAALFRDRTYAMAEGRGSIDDALPDTRVRWSEIQGKFDLFNVMDRVDLQPLYEKELRAYHLLQVLRRKETAEAWVQRMKTREG